MFLLKPLALSSLVATVSPFLIGSGRRDLHKISKSVLYLSKHQGKDSRKDSGKDLGKDSIIVPNKRNMIPKYVAKSENQRDYVQALEDKETPLVFVLGPAGTGKTLFACLTAIQGLRSGAFDRIILTRPLVTVEEELGFLPGNIKSKMDPWTRPIFDIFLEYYSQKDIDAMLNSGLIEISPLAFMRGRTFKRCFILADEMQNSSPAQMLMAATRIGHGSKMVVNGDLNQSDRGSENGLAVMVRKVRGAMSNNSTHISGISICDMASQDIERSPIVSTILQIMTPPSVHEMSKTQSSSKNCDDSQDAALIPHKDICRL